ncbi:MAG: hypothetical protein IT262_18875 [Saprospiraceae bacterium]|nr:hypothetical protein [Saprospiraceae bacterium]
MKNALFATIFILIFGCLCFVGLPWWSLTPIAALAIFMFPLSGGKSFSTGFFAGSMLWLIAAMLLNIRNAGMLSAKVGQLFMGMQSWHLLALTAFLGGLLAGFGALTGAYARLMFLPDQKRRRYNKYR